MSVGSKWRGTHLHNWNNAMRTPGTLHEAEENHATTLLNMTTHTTTSGGAAHLAESHPEHGAGREAEAEGLRHGTTSMVRVSTGGCRAVSRGVGTRSKQEQQTWLRASRVTCISKNMSTK